MNLIEDIEVICPFCGSAFTIEADTEKGSILPSRIGTCCRPIPVDSLPAGQGRDGLTRSQDEYSSQIRSLLNGRLPRRSPDLMTLRSACARRTFRCKSSPCLRNDAIVRLLRDDDPETVRLVKEQLALAGEEWISGLRDLAQMDDERVSRHARDVLAEIACQGADEEFLLLCDFFNDDSDLERACWMLAHTLDPSVDIEAFEHRVNQWGRQFLVRISGTVSNRQRAQALADFMADELCFRGNTDDYYSERNSLLPHVIETRMGIPITLAILYRMVAGRAGMKVDGINLPGHFIARHGEVLFDPFIKDGS
jgi:hypothetical protein